METTVTFTPHCCGFTQTVEVIEIDGRLVCACKCGMTWTAEIPKREPRH